MSAATAKTRGVQQLANLAMSEHGSYMIRLARGKFAVCGFDTDKWPTVQKSDPKFDTPQEAIGWATGIFGESHVHVHPSVKTYMRNMDPTTTLKREVKKLKHYLTHLTKNVGAYLELLDKEMVKPSDHERGRRIAKLSNALDRANDSARYFGLGVDYRTDKKRKSARRERDGAGKETVT